MGLIEKKCPNCGASLSFNETDKSCKCEYCRREFGIKQNNNNSDDVAENFDLTNPSHALVFLISILFFVALALIVFTAVSTIGK